MSLLEKILILESTILMLFTMSESENYRLEILNKLNSGKISRSEASRLIGVTLRQLDRLKKRHRDLGTKGVIHGNRGRPSNRAMTGKNQRIILNLIIENYYDFGPTLASEKLLEVHGVSVSREKVRQLMVDAGIWKSRRRRRTRAYCRRQRRSRRGELLQADASPHAWFEERGPRCDLIAFIDDATGMAFARFVETESTENYMRVFREYVELCGRPEALYTDKSSIFRVPKCTGRTQKVESTQFGRILKELEIELICAHSPQAKGRVERLFGTFQDRLIKELRLAGVSTMEEGNQFLDTYLIKYNDRFGKEPANAEDAHRPLCKELDLDRVFTWRERRKLSKSLDFSFHSELYQVVNYETPRRLMNKSITVLKSLSGEIWVECEGKRLDFMKFNETPAVPKEMDRKQLNSFLNRKPALTVKERVNRRIGMPT